MRKKGYISRIKFLSAYAVTAVAAVFYDSRVLTVMLLAFFTAEFFRFKGRYRLIFGSIVAVVVVVYGAQINFGSWRSSGGFLFSLF